MQYFPNTNYYDNARAFTLTHCSVRDIHGETWYPKAKRTIEAIAKRHNVTFETAAAVTAVLSPNIRWYSNVKLAERVIWSQQNSYMPYARSFWAYYENVLKAYDILRHGPIVGHNVKGRKVIPFFENLLTGGHGRPVIDVWMIRILTSDHRLHIKRSKINEKTHEAMQAAIAQLALELAVPVSSLQAALWLAAKRIARGRHAW